MKTLFVHHLFLVSRYEIYRYRGEVVGATKSRETHVTGGGGGGAAYQGTGGVAPVRISSYTTVHDDIFLKDTAGNEQAYQLSGFNVASREGNELTIVQSVRSGKEGGPYIVVKNHTTGRIYFNERALADMFRLRWLYLFLGTFVIYPVGNLLGGYGLILTVGWLVYWVYFNVRLTEQKNFKKRLDSEEFWNT